MCLCPGLDFHEDLHRIGAKEGLKGRKLQKAMESYAWNITVLKVSWAEPHLMTGLTTHQRPTQLHYTFRNLRLMPTSKITLDYNQLDEQS